MARKKKGGGSSTPEEQIAIFMDDTLDHIDTFTLQGRESCKGRFKQYNEAGTEDLDDWRRRFVATKDPTEYKAAIELLGSWAAWQKFKKNWPFFNKNILEQWHLEMEMSIRSAAMENLILLSQSTKGANAARFIVEGKHNLRKYELDPDAEVKPDRINARVAEDFNSDIVRLKKSIEDGNVQY